MYKVVTTLLCLLVSASLFAGNYFSPTPIDNGSYKIPEFYAGTWREQTKQDFGKTFTVQINPNVEGQLLVAEAYGAMRAGIMSQVNNDVYLSMYDAGGRERPEGYYVFRVEVINESEIKLTPLKSDLSIPDGKTLKEFLSVADIDHSAIEEPYAIWLTNTYTHNKRTPSRKGREINVKKK